MATKKKTNAVAIRRRAVSQATLDSLHACEPQQERFLETFGGVRRDRVEITAENVRQAYQMHMNVDWLLYRVLGRKWIAAFNTRRRNIHKRYIEGKITYDQQETLRNELIAKMLREHWGEK